MIFSKNRVFCECLLITRRIVIKKSIFMIPFHVVQQGYTVRLNTGSIPSQKINSLCSLEPAVPAQSPSVSCTRRIPHRHLRVVLTAEQGSQLSDLTSRRKASPFTIKKCYSSFFCIWSQASPFKEAISWFAYFSRNAERDFGMEYSLHIHQSCLFTFRPSVFIFSSYPHFSEAQCLGWVATAAYFEKLE